MEMRVSFTFNGMFMLYLKTFCLRKTNGGNQNLKKLTSFFLSYC